MVLHHDLDRWASQLTPRMRRPRERDAACGNWSQPLTLPSARDTPDLLHGALAVASVVELAVASLGRQLLDFLALHLPYHLTRGDMQERWPVKNRT